MIRAATAHDQPAIRALLMQARLPVDDLDDTPVHFLVAEQDGVVVGAIGLQAFGAAALLRSLVVTAPAQGCGTGQALVAALEVLAGQRGVRQLVLLTQTAEAFFARHGYAVQARDAVPAAIRASAEFTALCPASAVCMGKALSSP